MKKYYLIIALLIFWSEKDGVGKTYGFKKYVVNRFLKKGEKFLYIRRYDNELKSVFAKPFFSDVQNEFPEHKLYTKHRNFYVDDKPFGTAKRLTEAQDLKSVTFDDVKIIVFDEYAIEKNKRYYLPEERNDYSSEFWILLFVIVAMLKYSF